MHNILNGKQMLCLYYTNDLFLGRVEQCDMQRSMDTKEKNKRAVIEQQYIKPYWKQQNMLESSTVYELCHLQRIHADLCQGHMPSQSVC